MRNGSYDLLLLLGLWVLGATCIGLGGEFALNDDWSYATAVQRLLDEGNYRPTDWTSAPTLTHTLWGALFCLPTGFSFTALRLSTCVLGGLVVVATHGLLGELGAPRAARLLGTLVVACNPLHVALSCTFMTDVPFLAFATLALWLYLRSLRTRSRALAVAGTAVMLAATLNRQLGLFVAVAWLVGRLRRDGLTTRTVLVAATPLALGALALTTMQLWLTANGTLPAEYTVKQRALLQVLAHPGELLHHLVHGGFVTLTYLGLFLLPLLAWRRAAASCLARATGAAVTLAFAAAVLFTGKLMPFGFNVLSPAGIGPDLLRDVYVLGLDHRSPLPRAFWWLVTALAVWGAGRLVTFTIDALRGLRGNAANVVPRAALLAGAAAYLAPILAQSFLDRYLLAIVPLLAGALLLPPPPALPPPPPRLAEALAALTLVVMAMLAVPGTHDWLARARARDAALHWLQHDQGIAATRIDGGFEFHGLTTYSPAMQVPPSRSWWWVVDDEYVVTMGPLPGYDVRREFAVDRWLPPRGERVVVLQRSEPSASPR